MKWLVQWICCWYRPHPIRGKIIYGADTAKTFGFYRAEEGFQPDFANFKHDYTQEFYWSCSFFISKCLKTGTYPDHSVSPSHPIQYPTAGERTHITPIGLVMAGCWQINSILANIGRRNSIQILNQYPFFRNILIWAQFICFIKLFAF